MKALIFAAGKGERLRPITNHTPKPLVKVQGKPLLQYHIEALLEAGINDLVINVSWLKDSIIAFINSANFNGANIQFSIEPDEPLETGGGMLKALPLLGDEPFVVVNADVFTDFDFKQLNPLKPNNKVNLVLVNNPVHNSSGDFGLQQGNLQLKTENHPAFTYAGIGLYSPDILTPPFATERFSVVPYIKQAIKAQLAQGQLHSGQWHDVGTPDRLNELNQQGC